MNTHLTPNLPYFKIILLWEQSHYQRIFARAAFVTNHFTFNELIYALCKKVTYDVAHMICRYIHVHEVSAMHKPHNTRDMITSSYSSPSDIVSDSQSQFS